MSECFSILPTKEEVFSSEIRLPLTPNKVFGKWPDGNAYLETHFSLLREDLTRDLRYGLRDYATAKKMGRGTGNIKGIWIYKDVQIVSKSMDSSGLVAQFDIKSVGPIDWEV